MSIEGREIVRCSRETSAKLCIPERSRRFLVEVGLPREVLEVELTFDRGEIPAVVYAGPPVASGTPAIGKVYYSLGQAHQAFLFALEVESGRVVLLPDGGWRECGFVNSSIEGFGGCAQAFQEFVAELPDDFMGCDLTDAEAGRLAANLEAIDPHALYHPDCWWSLLLRRLRGEY